VAVTGRVARLAMVGSPASGGQVLDQYALDLSDDAMTELADTIIGTYRDVTESGNRVAATRLCLPDASAADTLRQRVASAGVQNVEVVNEAEAAAALARSVGADAALLLADDDTVSLTVVGADEQSTSTLASLPIGAAGAAVACAAVLQHVPASEAPMRVMLVGQRLDLDSVAAELRSMSPVEVAPDAGYAIARGAAQTADGSGFAPAGAATQMAPALDATQMAPAAADATQMAPAADATQMAPATADATQMAPSNARAAEGAVGPDLAYSQEAGDEPWADEMPMEPLSEFVPEQQDEADYTTVIAPPPPRMLLMGSAAMFLVISFATLAVTVAINVRPTADVAAQPVPPTQANTVPGRYLPPVPHQADPVALPVSVLTPPPAAPVVSNVRNDLAPVNQAPPAAPPPAPAPPPVEVPPAPVPVPIPAPIPVPIPVPPLVPPWTPPWTFPTTPTTPPTTTTTTSAPPITTTTTPTTATTTTTTTTTPPTTTTTAPTTTTTPPPTTTTTVPTTTTPPPTYTTPTYATPTSVVPVTPEPTYTAPSVPEPAVPAYTAPTQPAEQAPTREAPQTTVYQQAPAYGGGSSGGSSGSGSSGESGSSSGGNSSRGGHSGETPVTTMPASP
jgi:hypothetical protein